MIKVLFLGPDTSSSHRYAGGIQNIIQPLKEGGSIFCANGIDIAFFNTERMSRSAASGGRISVKNVSNAFKVYRDCSREIEKKQYEVLLYASSFGLALLKDILIARQLKKENEIKIFFQIHSADLDRILTTRPTLRRIIIQQLNAICDGCIFLSQKLLDQFIEHGFSRARAYLLYNYHNLMPCTEIVMRKLRNSNSNEKMRLLYIGAYDRQKGLFDLFYALETMDEALYSLDLCGGYHSDAQLKVALEDFCLRHSRSCVNHGYVVAEAKADIFARADVCILPSYSEGLPVVLLEAMASGCAIIATHVGAVSEVIKDGENGILLSAGDIEGLRNAILSMIQDREKLKSVQNRNFADADEYTKEKYINHLSGIIRENSDS